MQHLVRPDGLPPATGYSHVVAVTGTMLMISGQVPLDAEGNLVGHGDPRVQVRQVFHNLQIALAAGGARMADLVKLTVFLTDLNDLADFREVRDEFVDPWRPPASSLVQVRGLVHPGFRVEIDAMAALPPSP
jgi:enamine deaminase RidA (YjgF/YER057c/UK114 family)